MSKNIPELPSSITSTLPWTGLVAGTVRSGRTDKVVATVPPPVNAANAPMPYTRSEADLTRLLAHAPELYRTLARVAETLEASKSRILDDLKIVELLRKIVPPTKWVVELTETREYRFEIEVEADDEDDARRRAVEIANEQDSAAGYEIDGDDYSDREVDDVSAEEVSS